MYVYKFLFALSHINMLSNSAVDLMSKQARFPRLKLAVVQTAKINGRFIKLWHERKIVHYRGIEANEKPCHCGTNKSHIN